MDKYFLYLLISTITISIPGPGVIFTLTNAVKYRLRYTLGGILGVAFGMFVISVVAATGVGIIIKTSPTLYSIFKVLGALYLIYIGVKLFMASSKKVFPATSETYPKHEIIFLFRRGVQVSLTNPKPILFFTALFPQFIQNDQLFILEFLKLSISFCALVCLIHLIYTLFMNTMKRYILNSAYGLKTINRVGGSCFIFFALVLLISCFNSKIL